MPIARSAFRGRYVDLPRFSLLFPSNVSGQSQSSPYGVIEFSQPNNNGLPPAGPSNAGWTVIRRVKAVQQTGYYAQFWYSEGDVDSDIDLTKFYVGCHPYPQNGANTGTTHWWEIATGGGDFFDYDGGGGNLTTTKDQWFTQALKVEYNGGSPRFTYYTNLPDVTTTGGGRTVIRRTEASGYFDQTPAEPYKLTIGNSPWMAGFQEERASCQHGEIKIIVTALSEADIVSEGNNMNALVTSAAQANVWWAKRGFRSINDLTCDYGTGRSFTRNDSSNILTLGEAL